MRIKIFRITDAKDHIITGILLIIAVGLMVGRHQSGLNNLRKVSITVFSYLEEPLSDIRIYRQALKTNQDLRRQNVLLLDKLSRLRSAEQQNKKLLDLLEIKKESEYKLEAVSIVGKELNGIHNSLTIDAGTQDSIRAGMPVVSANGLIGRVLLASRNYSQVMPYFNNLFRVSARIQGIRAYGVVSWSGESVNELIMEYVPQTIPVDTGMVVETSGYSNQFPASIPIGKVVETVPQEGKETQHIYIKPFTNLYTVSEGFVIKFRPDSSINELKRQYENLFK